MSTWLAILFVVSFGLVLAIYWWPMILNRTSLSIEIKYVRLVNFPKWANHRYARWWINLLLISNIIVNIHLVKGSDLNLFWLLHHLGNDNIKAWDSFFRFGLFYRYLRIQNPFYSELIVEILNSSIFNNEWILPKKLIQKRDFLKCKFCLIFGHPNLLVELLDLISIIFVSVHDPGL